MRLNHDAKSERSTHLARRGWSDLGALSGNAIGASIRSDNLPFFDVLGAIVGLAIGFALFLWRSTRSS